MKFKFKPNVECSFGCEDAYYAMAYGGYIKPEELLADPKQVKAVQNAANLIQEFLEEVEERYGESVGLLEDDCKDEE